MSRWIRTTVDMLDHEALNVGPYDRRSAWLWLLTHAAWKDKRVNHKGRPLELKRGQVIIGRAYLAETWGWSEQSVRTFLALLTDQRMITVDNQSSGHFANVATICNYDKYQSAIDTEEPEYQPVDQPEPNQSLTSVQPEPNQTLTKYTSYTIVPEQGDARAREPQTEAEKKLAMRNTLNPMAAGVRATSIGWELNGSTGLRYAAGKLTIECADLQADLQADFPGVDLAAVCNKAASEVAKSGRKTHEIAIAAIRRAAQYAREDRDRRGAQAAPAARTTVLELINRNAVQ